MTKIFLTIPHNTGNTYDYLRRLLPLKFCQKALAERGIELKAGYIGTIEEIQRLDADVLVMGLAPNESLADAVCQFRGRLVWDCDDAFYQMHETNPAYAGIKANLPFLSRCLDRADIVWTTTERLRELIGYPAKTRIMPNLLDWDQVPAFREREGKDIVWWGGCSHVLDLKEVSGLPARLPDRRFCFFGMLPHELKAVEYAFYGATDGREVPTLPNVGFASGVAFDRFWPAIRGFGSGFGLGLCPMASTRFNEGKSVLKFLEMAAMSLCPIASNHPPYSDAIQHGVNGLLASNEEEWLRCIEEASPAIARAAYESVRASWSWQGRGHVWLEGLADAGEVLWGREPPIRWG